MNFFLSVDRCASKFQLHRRRTSVDEILLDVVHSHGRLLTALCFINRVRSLALNAGSTQRRTKVNKAKP